jgi:hypothetical protein
MSVRMKIIFILAVSSRTTIEIEEHANIYHVATYFNVFSFQFFFIIFEQGLTVLFLSFFLIWCKALHLCSPVRVFFLSFFLSRRTHEKLTFCPAAISRTGSQKKCVQTRDENIKTELVPFVFQSFLAVFVRL